MVIYEIYIPLYCSCDNTAGCIGVVYNETSKLCEAKRNLTIPMDNIYAVSSWTKRTGIDIERVRYIIIFE